MKNLFRAAAALAVLGFVAPAFAADEAGAMDSKPAATKPEKTTKKHHSTKKHHMAKKSEKPADTGAATK